jgi:hypothetical protein
MLKKEVFAVKLIPIQCQFSCDCGVALRFAWEQEESVKEILEKEKVEVSQLHRLCIT